MTFVNRLMQAAKYAGVGDTQAEIANSLGLSRQVVNHWFRKGGVPEAETLAEMAKRWGVNAEWLRSGEGEMLPDPAANDELPLEERELLRDYRKASQQTRQQIRTMVRALRKSVVTLAAVIPPLMVPTPSDARTYHNLFSADVIRIAFRRWLRALFCETRVRIC